MNIIKKIIEFLKKIGVLKVRVTAKTYKNSTDKNYEVNPLDND